VCADVVRHADDVGYNDRATRRHRLEKDLPDFLAYHSFDYFTDQAVHNFYSTIRFRIKKKQLRFYWINSERREVKGRVITALPNLTPLFYERFLCWLLPVNEVYFELEPVKTHSKQKAANTES